MSVNRRLETDEDFAEAKEKQLRLRVFRDDHLVESGSVIVRFDAETVVLQSGVSDLAYHPRAKCEFFELRRK
ncbi:hypothetical protein [Cohnella zeiphila]|uniref:Uncharacterized protein n=1 Tax=Cohnella zeiphila TaxID=2761120 RepID=A0A7X0SKX0_9BACL|nr:hypothetical protein [Cohnella zeiphila]MBB6731779.1 hypothetical protein [Cohnella zeiphila]